MSLTGIHVFKSVSESSYNEHVLMIQSISAIEWKKNNGPMHLYTTKKDLKFFTALGMDKLYSHIDTEVLEEQDDIHWPHFGPASKMKVLNSIQEFPVAFIDNDLIYRDKIVVNDESIIYLHDEGKFWKNYPPVELLSKRPGYEFPKDLPQLNSCQPINVGLFIINDRKLKEEYCELAMDFMKGNKDMPTKVKWAPEGLRKFWKPLFVEQRLLSAVVDRGGYKKRQIFPYTYMGDTLRWRSWEDGKEYTQIELSTIEQITWFHLWGEKVFYATPGGTSLRIKSFYNLLQAMDDYGPIAWNIKENLLNFLKYKETSLHQDTGYKI